MVELTDTLSGQKRRLKGRKGKTLSLFVCGITTYDFSHIGHAKTYISFDAFVKYLRSRGWEVFYLQNVTDIDDKIIRRAKEKNVPAMQLSRKFEQAYKRDMKALNVTGVTRYARATSYMPQIISQVERLLKKGYAYQAEDGIYYDISKFKRYGELSKRTVQQAEDATSRIDESEQKRNKGDFALWKLSKAGEPKWKSPWGPGRPGWHIEDTAITETFFGSQYDIHGGARDLLFPHHEAEIAQMEAISGKHPLVNYWMHTGFLTVKGEKMAKSLGNFITVREFLQEHSPRLLRLLVLKSHLRSPIDYSEELLLQTERELERIDEFADKLKQVPFNASGKSSLLETKKKIFAALDNDFNTPEALAELFEFIRKTNSLLQDNRISQREAKDILAFLEGLDSFLGFLFWGRKKVQVPLQIRKLAGERELLRRQQLWQEADELRKELLRKGWEIQDTSSGPKLKKR